MTRLRVGVIALVSLLASAGGVVIGARLHGKDAGRPESIAPTTARTVIARSDAVPGSSRLVMVGPVTVLDTRATGGTQPGADVYLRLPDLPPSTSAVVLNVSMVNATGPGAVTVASAAGRATLLRIPKAKAQTSATAVVPVGPDGALRVSTEGGGQLLVNLVGAFELAPSSASGRMVPLPPTRVLRLVPETDGKNAVINLAGVDALSAVGSVSAVLLRLAGDVGPNGGFVQIGGKQLVYWSATAGTDRMRGGFLIVPVTDGSISVHYEAGKVLTADVVGYVTDDTAPNTDEGLVVPVGGGTPQTMHLAPGEHADVPVVPSSGAEGVPAGRVTAALVSVAATGDAIGPVTVYPPDAQPGDPLMTAPAGAARNGATIVRTATGLVRVESGAGASIGFVVQALILGASA